MKRSGRKAAAGTACVAALVLVLAGLAGKDRLIEEWHLRRLEASDFTVRFQAARRLGELRSTRAIPGLIALLEQAQGHEVEACRVWGPDDSAGGSVAAVLAVIGPPAVPALARALEGSKDERERWRRNACCALGAIHDPSAFVALAGLLDDGYTCLRLEAIEALGSLGPEARAAIPALTKACSESDPATRHQASEALARIREGERGATR